MGRIADIITRVRDSLGDPDGDRWTDAQLLRVIDEAQKTIAREAKALRSKVEIGILTNKNEYDLPSDAYVITRVRDKEREDIPVKTHTQMDIESSVWETETGDTPLNVVFDKTDPKKMKIHPIPTADDVSDTYVINPYGVMTGSSEDVMGDDLGVVTDTTTDALKTQTFNSVYGIITDMSAVVTSLLVYYIRIPATINAVDSGTSVLEVHDVFDKAIKHYVAGTCLMDDKETRNERASTSELAAYLDQLRLAKADAASNYTKVERHTSAYRGFQ